MQVHVPQNLISVAREEQEGGMQGSSDFIPIPQDMGHFTFQPDVNPRSSFLSLYQSFLNHLLISPSGNYNTALQEWHVRNKESLLRIHSNPTTCVHLLTEASYGELLGPHEGVEAMHPENFLSWILGVSRFNP